MANYAFIDGNNVYLAIQNLGWKLDYSKFRKFLKEKHNVDTAYIFIGSIAENQSLYLNLQKAGFILVYKETFKDKAGKIKGNCDAELVLQAMIDYDNYDKAVIVTGDGDFACLIRYIKQKDKLLWLIVPDGNRYSGLLNKAAGNKIIHLNRSQSTLEYKKMEATK